MKILSLNTGSSSIKFKIIDMDNEDVLIEGVVERTSKENFHAKVIDYLIEETHDMDLFMPNVYFVITVLLEQLQLRGYINKINAVGHRVVHGADKYEDAVLINEQTLKEISSLSKMAPLHNPIIVNTIEEVMKRIPKIPNIAVFDTVFHKTLPPYAYMYPLPISFYKKYGVRKYGFHGISCKFVAENAAKYLNIDFNHFNCVCIHLGSGCSLTIIASGKSIDTTMGFTPMDGLMMSTRSGSIDVGVIDYLNQQGLSINRIMKILSRKSGLLGISGTNDMRKVVAHMNAGNKDAELAFKMFVTRVRKELASSFALLNRIDAIIFTGGIGENQYYIREKICDKMEQIGIKIDVELNQKTKGETNTISDINSKIKILVIPANEELEIARETYKICKSFPIT